MIPSKERKRERREDTKQWFFLVYGVARVEECEGCQAWDGYRGIGEGRRSHEQDLLTTPPISN